MSDDFEYEIVDPLPGDYNPEPPEVDLTEEEKADLEETV
jgi:hypothetical protein